jgi:catechol 2,3-dioxygenase-like lactoylglutathione lyase family enzyme
MALVTANGRWRDGTMELERIDHVAIVVKDLDESIHFYTQVLGMRLDRIVNLPEFGLEVAFVAKQGADIELMKFDDPTIPIGVRHICAHVPDVPSAAEALSKSGAEVVRPLAKTSLGFWYTMIRDPNGVVIELLDESHKTVPSAWRPPSGEQGTPSAT